MPGRANESMSVTKPLAGNYRVKALFARGLYRKSSLPCAKTTFLVTGMS